MGTTTERLSVLETKVDELVSQSTKTSEKVDLVLEALNKGNFDERISRIEKKDNNAKWITPIIYSVLGVVLATLAINFINHPGI